MNKHYIIYKTTNLLNNKIYIGQHLIKSENDSYLGSGTILKRAINKYKKENFKREVLEKYDHETSQEYINERETYWIDTFSSTDKEIGYNIHKTAGLDYKKRTRGSASSSFKKVEKDTALEIKKQYESGEVSKNNLMKTYNIGWRVFDRIAKEYNYIKPKEVFYFKGKNNPFYGKKHSSEMKRTWSIKRKGVKHTIETRRKIAKFNQGRSNKWLYEITDPEGKVAVNYEDNISLSSFCEEKGFNFKTFIKYTIYQNRNYKGWIAKRQEIKHSSNYK